MITLDPVTKAGYDVLVTADERAQAVIAALADPVSVRVYDASNTLRASGVMQSPWATRTTSIITVGELASFNVTSGGTPANGWYLQFESGTRYVRGSFGLSGSGADFTWSQPTFATGGMATLGTAEITAVAGPAPSAIFGWINEAEVKSINVVTGGTGYNVSQDAVVPGGTSATYAIVPAVTGIAINASTGLLSSSVDRTATPVIVEIWDGQPDVLAPVISIATFSSNTVTLSWTDPNGNETGVIIERLNTPGGAWAPLVSVAANVVAYTDSTVSPATEYSYRVRAAWSGGASNNSNTATVTTSAAPIAPTLTGKYRFEQPLLFQPIAYRYEPTRIAGGVVFDIEQGICGSKPCTGGINGPSNTYVNVYDGPLWVNNGGDWLDSTSTPQGTSPWATVLTNLASGSTVGYTYSGISLTALVQKVQTENRWLALYVRCPSGARFISGVFGATPPFIDVNYTDGSTGVLACRLTGSLAGGSAYPITTNQEIQLPCMMEFDRPTKAVTSAFLTMRVTQHWAIPTPNVQFFLINPPFNAGTVQQGVASSVALDAGLTPGSGGIIGVHRYVDGATLASFMAAYQGDWMQKSTWDPAILGTGAQDLSKLPHPAVGKFYGLKPAATSMVTSSYTGEGFVPLAAGLGALRTLMKKGYESGAPTIPVKDGSTVGYSVSDGTRNGASADPPAADAAIFMPADVCGLLDHVFVRQYVRIGTMDGGPYVAPMAEKYQVSRGPGDAWTFSDGGGKTFITPSHRTYNGGNSGNNGGGAGWQMRTAWREIEQQLGGPMEGGWGLGHHLYDFGTNNPVGYRYGGEFQGNHSWSQIGGMGTFYAHKWYCVEIEIKLNTVMVGAPGYVPDGYLRTYVDGVLAYERTGMVFRSLPVIDFNGINYNAIREIGIKELWFNWFCGGGTVSVRDRVLFITGLAWGTAYIGPMKLS